MIVIDPASPVPPFEQLRGQLATSVLNGELASGSRLPTVRKLAGDLGLAAGTVARAFRELETDGFVETRGRNGTVVRAQGTDAAVAAQEAAREYASRVGRLGVAPDDALRFVAAALGAAPADAAPADAAPADAASAVVAPAAVSPARPSRSAAAPVLGPPRQPIARV